MYVLQPGAYPFDKWIQTRLSRLAMPLFSPFTDYNDEKESTIMAARKFRILTALVLTLILCASFLAVPAMAKGGGRKPGHDEGGTEFIAVRIDGALQVIASSTDHTWLARGTYGTPSSQGSIMLDWRNDAGFGDFHSLIYGHNMANGSMFAELHHYRMEDFPQEHPWVYLVLPEGVLRYEIFAGYLAPVKGTAYRLSPEDPDAYIREALDASVFDLGITPAATDRIITLVTCTGTGYENRWILQARLPMVEEG